MPDPDSSWVNPIIRILQFLFAIPILGLARYIEDIPAAIASAAMLVYIPLTFSSIFENFTRRALAMETIFLAMWVYFAFVVVPAEECVVAKVIRSLCSYLV